MEANLTRKQLLRLLLNKRPVDLYVQLALRNTHPSVVSVIAAIESEKANIADIDVKVVNV